MERVCSTTENENKLICAILKSKQSRCYTITQRFYIHKVMKNCFFCVVLLATGYYSIAQLTNNTGSSRGAALQATTATIEDGPITFCPLWSRNDSECGDSLGGIVTCYRGEVLIHICYCMTYDKNGSGPFVSKCFFSCDYPDRLAGSTSSLIAIPCTASPQNLTHKFCSYWGREGLMCGDCKYGYAPRVYSFDMSCMPCNPDDLYINLIKYMSAALLGPTAFLLCILLLRIKITSGKLNWFIFFSQVVSSPFIARAVLTFTHFTKFPGIFRTYVRLSFSFYGIWNLDFFRPFMPGICFSSLDTRQAIALDGAIAVYPLLLLTVLYILINLHHKNNRIVVFLWKPFHVCFARCRQIWDIQNSVVDTFAAFILLSYSKVLNFVFDVGFPTRIYESSGKAYAEAVYYDASVRLYDKQHLLYLVVIAFMFLLFNIFPILILCCYPTRLGRTVMNRCGTSGGTLQTFSDIFQGYYKDGTEGTRDLRFFPAVYLLTRIVLIFIYSTVLTRYAFFAIPVVLVAVAMMVILLQPYKPQFARYNHIDAASILLLAMLTLTCNCMFAEPEIQGNFGIYYTLTVVLAVAMSLLPPLYVVLLLMHWIIRRIKSVSDTYQALVDRGD